VFKSINKNMLVQPNRLEQLHTVLQYCTEKGGYFSTGERICINQERGLLIQEDEPEPILIPIHPHSEKLTTKIDFIITKIKVSNWQPKPLEII
jgi:hypothetical protein